MSRRLPLASAAVLALVVLALVVLGGCAQLLGLEDPHSGAGVDASADSPADAPSPPAVRLVSAQEIEIVPQGSVIRGRSGGQSALLWQRSVWLFGTTVLNKNDTAGSNWHFSSMSSTDDLTGSDGVRGFTERSDTAGAPLMLLAPTQEEAAYNAQHAAEAARYEARPTVALFDAPRQRALVFYQLLFTRPGQYSHVGQSIALWSALDAVPDRPVVAPGDEHPTRLFRADEPPFGAGAALADGRVYALGCEPAMSGFTSPCKLAVAPVEEVLTRASWRFWNGTEMAAELADAVAVFDGGPQVSLAWNAHVGQWIAVYAEPLSNKVMLRSAPAPTGPWSAPVTLFQVPPRDNWWVTDAALHDEFSENGGQTLYVSYTRPTTELFGSELLWVRVDIGRAD